MAKAVPTVLSGGLSGSAGPVTFVRRRDGGTFIRQRDAPSDPATVKQLATRGAMTWANHSFSLLTAAEMRLWKQYAERLADLAWADRRPRQANALNAYRSLALKWIQLNGFAEPPRTPPTSPFAGDGIVLTASSESPGVLQFAASGPNSPGVVTELLFEPLRIAVTSPDPLKHRHAAFVQFAPERLAESVPAPRGWVSPAVRFVNHATGQTSVLLILEAVFVG